jgi:hypothetical protein
MRSHRHNRLFTQGDLGDELRSVERSIPGKVDGIPQDQFMTLTDQQLIDHFVELLSWVPLTLYEDHAQMEKFETEVDVSAEWFSRGLDQEEVPFWIHGTKVLIHYPFI